MQQRKPTPVQKLMIALMVPVWVSLFLWLIPEVRGVISSATEDTYSEWVWDLPLWAMLSIAVLHLVAGVLFVWSSVHFVEGWIARR